MKKSLSVVLLFLLLAIGSFANKTVTFATSERVPYIGKDLSNNGYVSELVIEAYKSAGYDVKIEFFPLARSMMLAKQGKVDGVLPIYLDETAKADFEFSDSFPGDTIGLMKRKDKEISINANPEDQEGYLQELKGYKLGVIRGSSISKEFDDASYLNKDFAKEDYNNLLKVHAGRIDLAVIDKYTAADIMVTKAPHLIGSLEFMEPPLAKQEFHIGFAKKSQDYQTKIRDFNNGLAELVKTGKLEEILQKHGLQGNNGKKDNNKKVIRIATVNNGDMKIMQKLSSKYEAKNPNIKLEWNVMDENTLRTRLMSSIAISDGKYDIMTIGAFETPIWGEKGWLAPVEGLKDSYKLDDILKPAREILSHNNKLFALPFYAESSMTYYRKDLFEEAGIVMPENPTYEQIMSYAEKIHNPEKEIYGIGLRGKAGWGENMAFLTTLVNSYGGRWFDENWEPQIDTEEWNSAISFYHDLMTKFGPPNLTSNGFNENKSLFANEQCAMWIDATVAAGMLYNPKESKVHDRVGFAAAPYSVTSKGSNWLWVWALGIPSSSKNKNEALDFISWATSQEYIELVGNNEGWVSVPPGTRYSTYKNENYLKAAPFANFVLKAIESADPNNQTLKEVPYRGIQFVGIPEFPAIGYQVGSEISKIFDENENIGTALKKAQEIAAKQMRLSGYLKK